MSDRHSVVKCRGARTHKRMRPLHLFVTDTIGGAQFIRVKRRDLCARPEMTRIWALSSVREDKKRKSREGLRRRPTFRLRAVGFVELWQNARVVNKHVKEC